MTTTTSECNLFPADPNNGDIFELQTGLLFQYDSIVNSWVKITSSSALLPLATNRKSGAMAAIDLKKLNRLVLPPPQSTIAGTDCVAPFQRGSIELNSGDVFVDVKGNLDIRNIDSFGDIISEEHAFQIHQHTYGFDFTLDIPNLVKDLISKDQINLIGLSGDRGQTGDTGDAGIDDLLTGPEGLKGEQGQAPECSFSIEQEVVSTDVRAGLKQALVDVRVVPNIDDPLKFGLEFDRQAVGVDSASVDKFNVKQSQSFWVLAVASVSGVPQPVFYLDIEPIVEAVRQKFLSECDRLKQGYEDVVEHWVQTMSDLFDEQKDALCCALEFCISKSKNLEVRQHMEAVAGAAVGANGAKINLHGRTSKNAVEISGTRMLGKGYPDAADKCKNGPDFPQNPAAQGGAQPYGEAEAPGIEKKTIKVMEPILVGVDPLLNVGSLSNAVQIELPSGRFSATIENIDTRIGTMHGGVIRIQHTQEGSRKVVQFLDKGSFESLLDAQDAYQGLSLGFTHDGGFVYAYFPMIPSMNAAGQTVIRIEQIPESEDQISKRSKKPNKPNKPFKPFKTKTEVEKKVSKFVTCQMTLSHLSWYKRGWDSNNCCGLVINVSGQDYIIFKRSIGDNNECGGGESEVTPCIAAAKELLGEHPAFAWPTLDGKTFAPLPKSTSVAFQYDSILNELAVQQIVESEYNIPKGNPAGFRHLVHQLSSILFPVA